MFWKTTDVVRAEFAEVTFVFFQDAIVYDGLTDAYDKIHMVSCTDWNYHDM